MPMEDDIPEQEGVDALTILVKSRILDRILADLQKEDFALGSRVSGYTKSDSGIYGKYQKADVDLSMILKVIQSEMDLMLAEYRSASLGPDADETSKPLK